MVLSGSLFEATQRVVSSVELFKIENLFSTVCRNMSEQFLFKFIHTTKVCVCYYFFHVKREQQMDRLFHTGKVGGPDCYTVYYLINIIFCQT